MDGRVYPWGNFWDPDKCRHGESLGSPDTSSVSAHPEGRSPWGLYNMAGNAWEWCAEWFDGKAYLRYKSGDLTLPQASSQSPPYRAVRSGGMYVGESYHRCAYRRSEGQVTAGIRVAKSAGF